MRVSKVSQMDGEYILCLTYSHWYSPHPNHKRVVVNCPGRGPTPSIVSFSIFWFNFFICSCNYDTSIKRKKRLFFSFLYFSSPKTGHALSTSFLRPFFLDFGDSTSLQHPRDLLPFLLFLVSHDSVLQLAEPIVATTFSLFPARRRDPFPEGAFSSSGTRYDHSCTRPASGSYRLHAGDPSPSAHRSVHLQSGTAGPQPSRSTGMPTRASPAFGSARPDPGTDGTQDSTAAPTIRRSPPVRKTPFLSLALLCSFAVRSLFVRCLFAVCSLFVRCSLVGLTSSAVCVLQS